MYAKEPEINKRRQVQRAAVSKKHAVVRKHAVAFRTKGIPLPDHIAAEYPLIVSSLGDPYPELGFLPLGFGLGTKGASSVLNIGKSLVSSVPVIGGLFKKDKNPGRLASNQTDYNNAINGDQAALAHLLTMSTSWATDVAKKDARAKYDQAKAMLANRVPSSPVPTAQVPAINQGGGVYNAPTFTQTPGAPKPPRPGSNDLKDFFTDLLNSGKQAVNNQVDQWQGQPSQPAYQPPPPQYTPPDPAANVSGAAPSSNQTALLIGGAVLAALVLSRGSRGRGGW